MANRPVPRAHPTAREMSLALRLTGGWGISKEDGLLVILRPVNVQIQSGIVQLTQGDCSRPDVEKAL